jgi:hypothetical protein
MENRMLMNFYGCTFASKKDEEKNANKNSFGELMMRLTGFLYNSRSEKVSDYMNTLMGDKIS